MMLKLAEIQSQETNVPVTPFEIFQDLLVKEWLRLHKVNDFALLPNTTPKNLNAIYGKRSGKITSKHIPDIDISFVVDPINQSR